MAERPLRVRFAPSPTGDLHVGNIRTALFNWAFARRAGGTFVVRLEDTDRIRSTDAACAAALETLHWLGLEWDEGPERGGPHGPYRQSERSAVYAGVAASFLADGSAYPCYCTNDEVLARKAAAGDKTPGYDNHCRTLTADERAGFEAAGRVPALRLAMPAGESRFRDLIRGEVVFDNATVPDFVIVRADGSVLYTLAAAVDDVQMQITHILRGEDLLPSTPRQLAVYAALGVPADEVPVFGHLPFVMGQDNQKLSKRNGEVSIAWYRQQGFLPETLVNYLALLGWSMPDEREFFTLADLAGSFDVDRVKANPARFDLKKLEALNGDHIRALPAGEFAARLTGFLQTAGLVAIPPTPEQAALVAAAAPLVQERCRRLAEGAALLAFLFIPQEAFAVEESSRGVLTKGNAGEVISAALSALQEVDGWTAAGLESALRSALVEGLGIKPRLAFGPVRVATTGATTSPPLFESLELLGREATLRRLLDAQALAGG